MAVCRPQKTPKSSSLGHLEITNPTNYSATTSRGESLFLIWSNLVRSLAYHIEIGVQRIL